MVHEFTKPLQELLAVARTGHLTEAARDLGVPQPTLSRSLARLSRQVGAPLLLKQGRGIALSRHGRLLADAAAKAVAEIDEAVRRIRADVDPEAGLVRLGFQHVLGADLVTRTLRDFHAARPGVRLQLAEGGADHLVADVGKGRLDLALVAMLDRVEGAQVLGTEPLRVLLPSDHPKAHEAEINLAALAGEPFVAMAEGYGMRTITDRLLRDAGLVPDPACTCEDLATAAGLVAAGLGITVVPAGIAPPGTVEVPLEHAAERVVQLLWNAESVTSPPVRALRDALAATVPAQLRSTTRTYT
ncbi:LysR family transcriptional regulator [Cryptosporangium sp. NPDC048952]|uniref:LysR family transcriptional regulator n=1 Tax=Cryptosporangium sp. NPDC048952 TaxID=3363961 RepID=UPI00370FC607